MVCENYCDIKTFTNITWYILKVNRCFHLNLLWYHWTGWVVPLCGHFKLKCFDYDAYKNIEESILLFLLEECIPDPSNLDSDPEMAKVVVKLRKTLQEACQPAPKQPPPNYDLVQSKVTLQSLGLTLGDKVMVGGLKVMGKSGKSQGNALNF